MSIMNVKEFFDANIEMTWLWRQGKKGSAIGGSEPLYRIIPLQPFYNMSYTVYNDLLLITIVSCLDVRPTNRFVWYIIILPQDWRRPVYSSIGKRFSDESLLNILREKSDSGNKSRRILCYLRLCFVHSNIAFGPNGSTLWVKKGIG